MNFAFAIAIVLAFAWSASAQTNPSSIEITPTHSRPDDPNGGRWFWVRVPPSKTRMISATIRNSADVPQSIRVYLRDLDFSVNGTPRIRQGPQREVGSWGPADSTVVEIPAKSSVRIDLSLTPPADVSPGDHLGAVVVESDRKVIGVRLYVTIPGRSARGFEIDQVTGSGIKHELWPIARPIRVFVRNTEQTTLPIEVEVGGVRAEGSRRLVSRSQEIYEIRLPLPWYGGPVSAPISAVDSETGQTDRAVASMFVIPWGLLAALLTSVVIAWRGSRAFRRRASVIARLHAEVAKAEAEPQRESIERSLKDARRTGSRVALERLALALHDSGDDALELLLEALERPGDNRREELIKAAASYGRVALLANRGTARLSPEVAAELIDAAQKRRRAIVS